MLNVVNVFPLKIPPKLQKSRAYHQFACQKCTSGQTHGIKCFSCVSDVVPAAVGSVFGVFCDALLCSFGEEAVLNAFLQGRAPMLNLHSLCSQMFPAISLCRWRPSNGSPVR
jgi:hypothetical protein